ncbi:MAG: TIGR01777 family oxidoreductase [Gemmatimonadota bacterium]|nr:TIGR01777 family oxidoreductase [Gemmatimonadota bacterium]
MKFLISGSSGLIGSSLIPSLQEEHGQVSRLVRTASVKTKQDVLWIPAKNEINTENLEGFDCVVHLAGESIVSRWTTAKKKRIRDSRVGATKLLTRALSGLRAPPKTLICASAVGYYGDRDDEILTEVSPVGTGFLAEICNEWEQAAIPAVHAGIRVVYLRFPVVLSTEGGALKKMLPPFRLGLGGVLGDGEQYMSWCTLDEVIQVIHHTIRDEEIRGPVNAGTQNPVTNRVFTETLGNVLHRPTPFK